MPVVQALLGAGADSLATDGSTAIVAALRSHHFQMARVLLLSGAQLPPAGELAQLLGNCIPAAAAAELYLLWASDAVKAHEQRSIGPNLQQLAVSAAAENMVLYCQQQLWVKEWQQLVQERESLLPRQREQLRAEQVRWQE